MGDDIAVEIGAERLLAVHSVWRTLAKRGLPRLCDLLESDAREADADLLLYLKLDNDYLVVTQGADRMRHIGRDLRGRTMSGFTQSVGVVLKELYDACLAQQTAIYARFVTDLASDSIYWEGLFLPLKGEDGDRTRFLASYATPIDNKTDVLQMVLDRSPTGTIVAVPVGIGPRRPARRANHSDQRPRQGNSEIRRERQPRELHSRPRALAAQYSRMDSRQFDRRRTPNPHPLSRPLEPKLFGDN